MNLNKHNLSKTLPPLIATMIILLGYNNCGKVNFHKATTDSVIDPLATPGPSPTPDPVTPTPTVAPSPGVSPTPTAAPTATPTPTPTPGVIETACNDPAIPHQSQTVQVSFPTQNVACNWGNNGNLSPLNNFFRGRHEQTSSFSLPAQSKICNLGFNFTGQSFRYDDQFIMTFNNMIIASSYVYTSYLTQQNGASVYDWGMIAGEQWLDGAESGEIDLEEPYCLGREQGLSTCSWPTTDTQGTISMSYQPSVIRNLMSVDVNRTLHDFKLIIIGDNDTSDCKHADPVNFTLTVDYVQ